MLRQHIPVVRPLDREWGGRAVSSPRSGLVCGDEHYRETVISLAAHGLDDRGADARLRGQQLVEAAHALDVGIVAVRVGHRAMSNDIVDNDEAAPAGESQGPVEVRRNILLVGIDEDEVEGAEVLIGDRGRVSRAGPTRRSTMSESPAD